MPRTTMSARISRGAGEPRSASFGALRASVCAALLALAPGAARADEAAAEPASAPVGKAPVQKLSAAVQAPARNWVNLRVGATTSGLYPHVCGELTPLEMLGVEACGNGAGFLHDDPAPELAHFRAKLRGPAWKTRHLWLEPWAGVGFAELQVGEDGAGFAFLDTGATGVETAGPEVSGAVRALVPIALGFELIADLSVGAAYLPHAPELRTPQSALQLSAAVTVGAGF